MPLYSLLVSMPAETAGRPPTTRLPTAVMRVGGSLVAFRLLHARDPGLPATPGCGAGPASRTGPLRSFAEARSAARAWLRRTA